MTKKKAFQKGAYRPLLWLGDDMMSLPVWSHVLLGGLVLEGV